MKKPKCYSADRKVVVKKEKDRSLKNCNYRLNQNLGEVLVNREPMLAANTVSGKMGGQVGGVFQG
jgi:hypothetical protein